MTRRRGSRARIAAAARHIPATVAAARRHPTSGIGGVVRRVRTAVVGERRRPVEMLDARLLPAALCCWLTTLAVILVGWVMGVVVAVAVSITLVALWATLRGPGFERRVAVAATGAGVRKPARVPGRDGAGLQRIWVTVAVASLGLTLGFALSAGWRAHQVEVHPLRQLGEKARIEVTVTPNGDPKPVRGTSFDGGQRWVVRADLREYRRGDVVVRAGGAVVVLAGGDGWAEVSPGQEITFDARVAQPERRDLTAAVLRAEGAPEVAGPLPWWQRAAGTVRAELRAAAVRALPEEAAGLLPALVVGDTGGLSDSVRDEFEIAGLQHLCVVSGANFAILGTAVLSIARRLTMGPRASVGVAAAAMAMFVVIARPDPSVLRAAAMGAVTLLALLTGRRKQALPALCAAVIAVLLIWPDLAVSAGFALSVLATGGLILLAPGWAQRLRDRGWWQLPAELVAVSAAAFTVTLPIMVALSGRVSVVAIAANVLVAPVVAPITVIGAAAAAVAWLWSPLAQAVLHLAIAPMWWLLTVGDRAAALPGAAIDVPGGTAGGFGAAVAVVSVVLFIRSLPVRATPARAESHGAPVVAGPAPPHGAPGAPAAAAAASGPSHSAPNVAPDRPRSIPATGRGP